MGGVGWGRWEGRGRGEAGGEEGAGSKATWTGLLRGWGWAGVKLGGGGSLLFEGAAGRVLMVLALVLRGRDDVEP